MASELPNSAEEFFAHAGDENAQQYTVSTHGDNTPDEDRTAWQVMREYGGALLSGVYSAVKTGVVIGTAFAVLASSVAAIQHHGNDYRITTLNNTQSIHATAHAKAEFNPLAERYEGLFDQNQSIYVFKTTDQEVEAAISKISLDSSKEHVRHVADTINDSYVSATMVGFAPSGQGHQRAMIFTGTDLNSVDGMHNLDHETYHAWEMMHEDYTPHHEDASYESFLKENGADAFAAMMQVRDNGSMQLVDVLDKNESDAAVLFDQRVPLYDAVEHYTNKVENIALAQGQQELQSLTVEQIAQKAAELRDTYSISYGEFQALKGYVGHVRNVVNGSETMHNSLPNDAQFTQWADHFAEFHYSFRNENIEHSKMVINHYDFFADNQELRFEDSYSAWKDYNQSKESELGQTDFSQPSTKPGGLS